MPLAWAADRTPSDLVLTQTGSLPIILTAPHGGREPISGIPPRNLEGKKDIVTYTAGGDPGTDIIVQVMAREIRALTGKDVYMVMARFDRKFIDANRGPAIAYDNPASEPYHQHYHQSIRRFVDEIRATYPAGLLIDVHGQRKFPDHLVRGTWNGRAVTKLLGRGEWQRSPAGAVSTANLKRTALPYFRETTYHRAGPTRMLASMAATR